MHIILQIFIGLMPLIITTLFMFFMKKNRAISSCVLAVVLVTMVVVFVDLNTPKGNITGNEQTLYLAESYINSENYAKAKELLNNRDTAVGESVTTSLNRARIMVLEGDIDAAAVLYEKAIRLNQKGSNIQKNEQEFAKSIIEGQIISPASAHSEGAMISYIESTGKNPVDYGYTEASVDYKKIDDAVIEGRVMILDNIADELDTLQVGYANIDELSEGLNLKNDLDLLKESYAEGNYIEVTQVEPIAEGLHKLYKSNPELFTADLLDNSYLEAITMANKYEYIVDLAEAGKTDALITAANLYSSGQINSEAFSEDFVSVYVNAYEKVIKQCDEIFENSLKETENNTEDIEANLELSSLTKKLDNLHKTAENLVMVEIQKRVNENVEKVAEEEKSKTYLQLAGINYYLGNTEKAEENFENSMNSVSSCKDENFTAPLNNIIGVLSGNETDYSVMDTASNIETAFYNSSPVNMEQTDEVIGLSSYISDYVSTKISMLNISSIDISEFPTVKANVQFGGTVSDMNSILDIIDSTEKIENYTLKKKVYSQSNVILTCDISGSMSGREVDLQNAITQFVDNKTDKETISIVGFNDTIQFDTGFTKEEDTLYSSAKQLLADGNTDIYGALLYSINNMPSGNDDSKVIIIMTDGMDGYIPTQPELDALRKKCDDSKVIVYTLGLGSEVNETYLETLANCGNGKFIYCNDATNLQSLYDFIHAQIDNTYELSFEAVDTTTNKRVLELTDKENTSNDSKTYYLVEPDTAEEDESNIGIDSEGIAVLSADKQSIYAGDNVEVPINAIGYGFSDLKDFTISLDGDKQHYTSITGTVTDDTHILFNLPKNIALGSYSLSVNSGGKEYKCDYAFSVYEPGSRTKLIFGAYTFEANSIIESGGSSQLTGDVVMNGFLHFKDAISLSGSLAGTNLSLTDSNGSYINFNKELPGLLKYFSVKTITMPLLETITLFNDEMHKYDYKEYKVESKNLYEMNKTVAVIMENPSVSLYPDRVEFSFGRIGLDFPCQKDVLKKANQASNPFTADASASAVANKEGYGLIVKAKGGSKDGVVLGALPLSIKDMELNIDTFQHNYDIGAMVGLSMFEDIGFGFKVGIKSGKWDTILIKSDFEIPLTTPIPVSLSNFFFGLEGMSEADQTKGFANIMLNSYITGGTDIKVGSLGSIIKPLRSLLDDISLCTFEETKFKCRLATVSLSLETKLKLLGGIDVGQAEIKIGTFDYDNYLLGIDKSNVVGVYARLKNGIIWDTPNIDVDISGEGLLTLNNKFAGFMLTGLINYEINVFFIETAQDIQGNFLAGLHNNGKQFSIIIKGRDLNKNKQGGIWLSFNQGNLLPSCDFY